MDKSKLGTKRLCAGCAAPFYDLNNDPIVCPKCQVVFIVPPVLQSRPPRFPRAFQPYGRAVVEPAAAEGADDVADVLDDEDDDKEEKANDALLLDDEDDLDEQKTDGLEIVIPEKETDV